MREGAAALALTPAAADTSAHVSSDERSRRVGSFDLAAPRQKADRARRIGTPAEIAARLREPLST
jgi:hypothetical protein